MLRATTACTFSTSQLPKVVREWCVLYILTSKCASRHNGVHFFDIATSKSGPTLRCFVHFDLEMCFAPQRRSKLPSTTTTAQLHSTTLHYTTLHYLPLHLTTLHYIILHYAPLHYNYNYTTTLHYTPLH